MVTEQHATALGIHPDVIKQATDSGISIAVLLQLLMTYGPSVLQFLAKLFNWQLPPNPLPTPPPLPYPPGVLTKP